MYRNIRLVIAAGVVAALALAPSAVGGSAAPSCPQAAASSCEPIGARPGGGAGGKQQRARLQLRLSVDRYGQQVWCARNHCAS